MTPRRRSLLVALALVACLASRSRAELPAETRSAIDARVDFFLDRSGAPGLSIAVVDDLELAYERGYGLADVENEVAANSNSVYRLASISKMLTAVAIMQLVEAGKLDLDAPIQTYVPGFPEKQAPLTAGHLLKHQGGVRHYRDDEALSAVHYDHVRDSFGVFQDDPLLFTPGEKFSYTTYGYNVLGAAIEGASGVDYVSYVRERVAAPAGMTSLRPDHPADIIPHRAAGYRRDRFTRTLRNDVVVDVSNKIPGGGWCSTPSDLARFAIALVDGKLVSRETLERMWTPQQTTSGEATTSGLGCFIQGEGAQRRVSHAGGQPKVSTLLVIWPDRRQAVALMCNLSETELDPLADAIGRMLAERQP